MELPPGIAYFLNQLSVLLFAPGSHFSLTSLACALTIAVVFVAWQRHRRGRPVRPRAIMRALFPRRILFSASNLIDLTYLFYHVFLGGLLFGWAVISYQFLTNGIIGALAAALGPVAPTALPAFVARAVITAMLFLAYELGYWLNHYLSHRVAFLWEFHRVHHTATVLTPVTNFRVHPVYTFVFVNILAIATAIANGVGNYMFGETAYQYALNDTNIILVVFIHTYVHLQHTEVWIAFSGALGRVFMSPAHHQVHHSTDPAHFNKNLGSCLALWDWMFGTLYVPGKAPEKLSFGVEPDNGRVHTIAGAYIDPFVRAASLVRGAVKRRRAPSPRRGEGWGEGVTNVR
ncbi:MAG TPA: sterol desaturase family protein [Xanthobacteraceae bacterium]|nr:sterol desaturase family protein [Xanthobacteraceae bacterium]